MSLSRLLSIGGFLIVGLAILAVELAARKPNSRVPRLSEVTGVVMRYEAAGLPVGRLAVLGFWFWLGWHFLAR
jgi:hypothetical protein